MQFRMDYCLKNNFQIIYIDEVIFQIHEIKMKKQSNLNQNIIIQKNKRDNKNITIIAAINSDGLIFK